MDARLEEELAALATMSPAQLRDKWQRVYREPPPPFAPDLLARGIAYRLQEKVYGKLPAATRREIERLQRQYEKTGEVLTFPDRGEVLRKWPRAETFPCSFHSTSAANEALVFL